MRVGKEPQAVLVLDCGATNVRAICVSAEGRILAARAVPNAASPDPGFPTGMIWDHERIWRDFSNCARGVVAEVGAERIGALTVTTFGVDGTLVDKDGAPLYPVISWRKTSDGWALNLDGTEGPRVQSTRAFVRNLVPLTTLPVVLWDERLSTLAVTRTLLEADASRARRAAVVDKMAAAYILQGALDRLKRAGEHRHT